jgi:hypothetical protein
MTLVGWWPLHDSSAQDYSGNGNHGTPNGGVTTGVAGRGGLEAMSFDGTDDYIDTPNPLSYNDRRFAFGGWVRPRNSGASEEHVISVADDGSNPRTMLVWRGDHFSIYADDGSNVLNNQGHNSGRMANEWYHVFLIRKDDTWYTVVDGEVVDITTKSLGNTLDSSDPADMEIGRAKDGTSYIDASICDVRAYKRDLTLSEVYKLYKIGNTDLARPPTNGISRYPLDGDATDAWGSNDGTNNGVTFVSNAVSGQSGYFEGSNTDYIEINDGGDNSTWYGLSELTVSMWVNPDSINDWQRYIEAGGTNNSNIWMLLNKSGSELAAEILDSNGNLQTAGYGRNLPTNVWSHIAFVVDSNSLTLYVNGTVENRVSTAGGIDTESDGDPVRIGKNNGSSEALTGHLDDVRIYDYALEPHEVFEVYQWGTRGKDMRKHLVNRRQR